MEGAATREDVASLVNVMEPVGEDDELVGEHTRIVPTEPRPGSLSLSEHNHQPVPRTSSMLKASALTMKMSRTGSSMLKTTGSLLGMSQGKSKLSFLRFGRNRSSFTIPDLTSETHPHADGASP